MKRMIALLMAILMVVVFLGCSGRKNAGLGKATSKEPKAASVIYTKKWGNVPVNQIIVVFKDDINKNEATALLKQIGGKIVGGMDLINLYQIETDFTTEAQLTAAIDIAIGMEGVESAFPNTEIFLSDIEGTPCSPLKDPIFENQDNAAHYNTIGMENSWKIIKGSGVKLNKVNVGVLDSAISSGSGEFGGKVKVSGDTTEDEALSHGTKVTHVIGADYENSGMVGIASVLDENLEIKTKNLFDGEEYRVETELDEDDITQGVKPGGTATTLKALVYLKEQVDNGATVINCSFNYKPPSDSLEWEAKACEKFVKAIQKTKPNVIFVVSAGNSNAALNGKNDFLAGMNLPNVITVGSVNNDGSKASTSCYAEGNGEVTISAPGVNMVLGVDKDGKPIKASGTSFSAPQVTAAIALIQSINPKLNAGQIKDILVETAAPGITTGDQSIPIPAGMGSGVLRVDVAVLKTINDMRAEQGKAPFTFEQLFNNTIVSLSASGGPLEYKVTAGIFSSLNGNTDVKIEVSGGQHAIKGNSTQKVAAGGEVKWDITLVKEPVFVRVTRLDNGGCAYLTLKPEADVTGVYNATGTVTMWGDTDPIKNFQAKVEKNGDAIIITFSNDTDTILTGTYDEASKTFIGKDTRVSDDPFASSWWQWGETNIVFDTSADPVKASGRLFVPNTSDLTNTEIIVVFTMTKIADK